MFRKTKTVRNIKPVMMPARKYSCFPSPTPVILSYYLLGFQLSRSPCPFLAADTEHSHIANRMPGITSPFREVKGQGLTLQE